MVRTGIYSEDKQCLRNVCLPLLRSWSPKTITLLSQGPYFIWHISFAASCRLAYRTNVAHPSDRPWETRTRGGKRKTTVDRKTKETVLLHTIWGLIGLDPWRAGEKHSDSWKTFIGHCTFPNAYKRIVSPFFLKIRLLGYYPMSLGEQLPTFPGIVVPSSSGATAIRWKWRHYDLRNFGCYLRNHTG